MLPENSVSAVGRMLNLPPWEKHKELNFLKRQFRAGMADGMSEAQIEAMLGTPEEAAEQIRYRYPDYYPSPLRHFATALVGASGVGLYIQIQKIFQRRTRQVLAKQVIKQLEVPDFLTSSEYVIRPKTSAPPVSVLSEEALITLCILGILFGVIFYFYFYFTPCKKGS